MLSVHTITTVICYRKTWPKNQTNSEATIWSEKKCFVFASVVDLDSQMYPQMSSDSWEAIIQEEQYLFPTVISVALQTTIQEPFTQVMSPSLILPICLFLSQSKKTNGEMLWSVQRSNLDWTI